MNGRFAKPISEARLLVIGAGGLGSPALLALAGSGLGGLTIVDDDRIEHSNLHRQVLFSAGDVGQSKASIAASRVTEKARTIGYTTEIACFSAKVGPSNVRELLAGHDVVVEGADNFATKFLVADACVVAGTPLVSAGVLRWSGWALAWAVGGACLRCVFEAPPSGYAATCADAGVVGSVAGVLGSLQAALAIQLASGGRDGAGTFLTFDGLSGAARSRKIARRPDCGLCGRTQEWSLLEDPARYHAPGCAP